MAILDYGRLGAKCGEMRARGGLFRTSGQQQRDLIRREKPQLVGEEPGQVDRVIGRPRHFQAASLVKRLYADEDRAGSWPLDRCAGRKRLRTVAYGAGSTPGPMEIGLRWAATRRDHERQEESRFATAHFDAPATRDTAG